jgi:hypothetical protein
MSLDIPENLVAAKRAPTNDHFNRDSDDREWNGT